MSNEYNPYGADPDMSSNNLMLNNSVLDQSRNFYIQNSQNQEQSEAQHPETRLSNNKLPFVVNGMNNNNSFPFLEISKDEVFKKSSNKSSTNFMEPTDSDNMFKSNHVFGKSKKKSDSSEVNIQGIPHI